jgi:peptide-methionine (S)-S-oxide reductase
MSRKNLSIAVAAIAAATASIGISTPAQAATDTAVLAGGCFWGMEAVFEHVKGVKDVVSGYAGGSAATANYSDVSSEATGHAEAVKISYDPAKVSYTDLLKIYFTVAHDPTQLNRQSPDTGPSYRSAIFPQTAAQKKIAAAAIANLNRSHAFKKPVVTKIESGGFYPAEAEHQNFYDRHPYHPYIVVNDKPKVAKLKRTYPQFWSA